MRVLVVEDNVEVARQLKDTLERELFVVDVAGDGEKGWFMGDTESYDAVILDLGLPKLDGITVLQRWRQGGNHVPVLILTSRDTWREKVAGLRAGADDYLAKPFELEELLARIEALLRRSTGHSSPILKSGPVEQFRPKLSSGRCRKLVSAASASWPPSITPNCSMVTETMIGSASPRSANTMSAASKAVFRFRVSRLVSNSSASTPPSISPRRATA